MASTLILLIKMPCYLYIYIYVFVLYSIYLDLLSQIDTGVMELNLGNSTSSTSLTPHSPVARPCNSQSQGCFSMHLKIPLKMNMSRDLPSKKVVLLNTAKIVLSLDSHMFS